jgi:hypothetical protein
MQTRSNIFLDQSGLSYWTAANTNNPASVPFTPAANNQTIRLMQSGVNLGTIGASPGRLTNQPLFTTTPSVSGKNIYDWSAINLSSVNRLMDETQAFNSSSTSFAICALFPRRRNVARASRVFSPRRSVVCRSPITSRTTSSHRLRPSTST